MPGKEKIGLGTVQFGLPYGISNSEGQTAPEEVREILHLAVAEGISVLDSASAYGNAEEVVGQFLLEKFEVVSKFMPKSYGRSLPEQFRDSLERLKIDKLYGYLAHRPLDLIENSGDWEHLKGLKESGKIQKAGFSLNEPYELDLLLEKGFFPDLVQVPYNYFDRRFEAQLQRLKEEGCEIHTRSSFLQGLFFMEPAKLHPFFNEIKHEIEKLQSQTRYLAGGLLKFVMAQTFIDKVIVGVQTKQQLAENLSSIQKAAMFPELGITVSDHILIPSKWPKN